MTSLTRWRKTRKQWLVNALGGGCNRCGYNKCLEGLDFHHITPETKKFAITLGLTDPRNTKTLIDEAKKCCLLCRNCHAELHAGLWDLKDILLVRFDESVFPWYVLRNPRKCRFCGNFYIPTHKTQKYCTFECSKKCPRRQVKYRPKGKRRGAIPMPSKEYLGTLLWKMPSTKIAKIFNVSDRTVGKWADKYKLDKPPRGYWSTKKG